MLINKRNFFVQVKYADLISGTHDIGYYFLGFGGELYLSSAESFDFQLNIIKKIQSFIKSNNLSLMLHLPIVELDYSKPEETINNTKSLYKKVLGLCKSLAITTVVGHAEFGYNKDLSMEMQLTGAKKIWHSIGSNFHKHNISINIENHCESKPEHLIRLMKEVNISDFGMCVDLGHVNAFSSMTLHDWIREYPKGSIREVHLADNKGDGDTHLPLGRGTIDFRRVFEILEKRKDESLFVLEPRETFEAEESINYLKKAGFLE